MKKYRITGNWSRIKDFLTAYEATYHTTDCWTLESDDITAFKAMLENQNLHTPEASGQLWEECPGCGRDPVYMSLGGLCKRCGGADKRIYIEEIQ